MEGAIAIITHYIVYISITFFLHFHFIEFLNLSNILSSWLNALIEKLTTDRANSHYEIGSNPIRMLLRKLDHK